MSCRNIPNPSMTGAGKPSRREKVALARSLQQLMGGQSVQFGLREQRIDDLQVRQQAENASLQAQVTAAVAAAANGFTQSAAEALFIGKADLTLTDAQLGAGGSYTIVSGVGGKTIYAIGFIARCDITNATSNTVSGTLEYIGPGVSQSLGGFTMATAAVVGVRATTIDPTTYNIQSASEDFQGASVALTLSAGFAAFETNGGYKLRLVYTLL